MCVCVCVCGGEQVPGLVGSLVRAGVHPTSATHLSPLDGVAGPAVHVHPVHAQPRHRGEGVRRQQVSLDARGARVRGAVGTSAHARACARARAGCHALRAGCAAVVEHIRGGGRRRRCHSRWRLACGFFGPKPAPAGAQRLFPRARLPLQHVAQPEPVPADAVHELEARAVLFLVRDGQLAVGDTCGPGFAHLRMWQCGGAMVPLRVV